MKTFILPKAVVTVVLLSSLVGCGSESKKVAPAAAAVPERKDIALSIKDDGTATDSIAVADGSSLSQVTLKVSGVAAADVLVTLLNAPSGVSMRSTGSLDYELSGDGDVASGTYSMQFVARDTALCAAKETDKSVCTSIKSVNENYDTSRDFTVQVGTVTDKSTDTGTIKDTSTGTGSDSSGGGLLSNLCKDTTDANILKKALCSLFPF